MTQKNPSTCSQELKSKSRGPSTHQKFSTQWHSDHQIFNLWFKIVCCRSWYVLYVEKNVSKKSIDLWHSCKTIWTPLTLSLDQYSHESTPRSCLLSMTYRLNPPSYFLVNEVCECGIINSMAKVVLVPTLILVIFLVRARWLRWHLVLWQIM